MSSIFVGGLIAVGSAVLTGLATAVSNKVINATINITLFSVLFFIVIPLIWDNFGFPVISMPDGLLDLFSHFSYIYYIVGYFIDIKFILSCLLVIMLLRYAHLFVSLFNFIIGKILGIFYGH